MFFQNDSDKFTYLNYVATMTNVGISFEILQLNKLIYQSNEKRNEELSELLKELRDEIKIQNKRENGGLK